MMQEGFEYTVEEHMFVVILEFKDSSTATKFKSSDIPKRFAMNFHLLDGVKLHRLSKNEKEKHRRVLEVLPGCVKNRISLIALLML